MNDLSSYELREADSIVFRLWDTRMSWCIRVFEEVDLSGVLVVKRIRTVDAAPLRLALRDILPVSAQNGWGAANSARLKLPVAILPKDPLLTFDVQVAGQAAHRISKSETVRLHAGYLVHAARQAGLTAPLPVANFFSAISNFQPGVWRIYLRGAASADSQPLRAYLDDGLFGTEGVLDDATFDVFLEMRDWFREFISPYAPYDHYSSAQNPLLALPDMKAAGLDVSPQGIEASLTALAYFLLEAKELAAEGEPSAQNFLRSYADFGRRWVALSECKVPLDEPFSIVMSEKRGILFEENLHKLKPSGDRFNDFFWMRKTLVRRTAFRDAETNQVNIVVTDPNVELVGVEPLTEKNDGIDVPLQLYKTPEVFYISSSSPSRSHRLKLVCRVQPSMTVRWLHWLILLAMVATPVGIGLAWEMFTWVTTGHLALMLTPITFAASLLLVREASPLSSELTSTFRRIITVGIGLLWVSVIALYLGQVVHTSEHSLQPKLSNQPK
ncbi:hypothetical protein [Streptomyces albogriseolus]|uniref:Uncharacterized protein n=1 Tax=Streptomyces albogriseolus TaxID=1887 RepID=A0ACC6UYI5_STRAO